MSSLGSREMDWLELSPKEKKKLTRISCEIREREEQLVAKKRAWVEKHLAAMDEALWGQTSHPLTGIWHSILRENVCQHLVVMMNPGPRLGGVNFLLFFYKMKFHHSLVIQIYGFMLGRFQDINENENSRIN